MTSRLARLCLTGLLLSSFQGAFAQTPPPQPQRPAPTLPVPAPAPRPAVAAKDDDPPTFFKLPDADIDSVLSTLEMLTGKIILRPSQLPVGAGTFNLKITKPIPKSQAILYLETILAMNQIAVIPMGPDALKIVPLNGARTEAPELIMGSTLELAPSSRVASKLFQFEFLRAQDFQAILGSMVNGVYGQPVPLANANAMLITDTISNLQRIETIQRQIDHPIAAGLATKFYPLRNGAKASDTVNKMRTILSGAVQAQLGSGTTYSPDDRSNQIVVITDPRLFSFFDELIAKLDVKADPNTRNEVIYLKHAKAADLVAVLVRIIQGQNQVAQKSQSTRPTQGVNTPAAPTPANAGQVAAVAAPISGTSSGNAALDASGSTNEFSSLITVVSDDRSNAVVVSGTVDDIRLLRDLIDKLDIVLRQVRIEVVIAEVTIEDNDSSGISALGLKLDGDKLVGISGSGSDFKVAGSDGTGYASINSSGTDLSGTIGLTATLRKNNTTILTVPAIVTSHGKKAVITDGEKRPTITGSTNYNNSSTNTTSSQITQQEIGTTLTVTPFIGDDGTIQLDIEQELTNVTGKVTIDGNEQYIIGNRKATSYVTARSGEIHVLGGFRQVQDSKQRYRLGPIPIIGDLFGQRTKNVTHQELIFFLRPRIITDNPSVDNAEVMKSVNELPTRDEIKSQLDPTYQAPKKSILDKILPK